MLFTLMFDEWPAKSVNDLVETVIKARSKTDKQIELSSKLVFGIPPAMLLDLVNEHAPKELTLPDLAERSNLVGLQFE